MFKLSASSAPQADPICRWCAQILSEYIDVEGTTPQATCFQSTLQLDESAKNGCEFCLLRRRQISVEEFKSLDLTAVSYYGFSILIWAGREDLKLTLAYPSLGDRFLMKSIRLITKEAHGLSKPNISSSYETYVPNFLFGYPLPFSRKTELDWGLARSWINGCLKNHPQCRSLQQQATITNQPCGATRLIDLGPNFRFLDPKLCAAASLGQSPRYATLSHCWGGTVPVCLTQKSLQQFFKALPVSALPRKFIEAMGCAKRLDVRYLWIDSLCIIQDSEKDWETESSRMHTIFKNAYCNIAAAAAPTVNEPLFSKRVKIGRKPVKVGVGLEKVLYLCDSEDLWTENVSNSPLLKRGWVLQEIILAQRNLYFCKDQMFWECVSLQACESWPMGIPKAANIADTKISLVPKVTQEIDVASHNDPQNEERRKNRYKGRLGAMGLPTIGSEEYMKGYSPGAALNVRGELHEQQLHQSFLHLWPEIVLRYSRAALTYSEKDKLVAISGLARSIYSQGDYVAGLWKSQLPYSLAWYTTLPAPLPCSYQAPSWSWASTNGSVRLPSLDMMDQPQQNRFAQLLSVEVTHTTEDCTGRAKHGRIHLRTPMYKLVVRSCWREESHNFTDVLADVIACQVDGITALHIIPDSSANLEGRLLHFAFIHRVRGSDKILGIVLERQDKGVYSRVGYFEIVRPGWKRNGKQNYSGFKVLSEGFLDIVTYDDYKYWDGKSSHFEIEII